MEATWLRLDNAAKLYPAKMSADDTCVFRVYAILKEEVQPSLLQESVLDLKMRFPTLYVKLRNGFFWNYYEQNEKNPSVNPESGYISSLMDGYNNNGYLFSVQFFRCRISIEVFHALGDGTTAITYLNALLYRYLTLLGHQIDPMGRVATCDQQPCDTEKEDSYSKYYTGKQKRDSESSIALRIKGTPFPSPRVYGVMHGVMNSAEIVNAAHRFHTTVTQYLTALFIQSIWLACTGDGDRYKCPICINVPVNMRNLLPSKTLRNFSLFITVHMEAMESLIPFDEILACVEREFSQKVRVPILQKLMNANVSVEKSKLIACFPLTFKRIGIDTVARFICKNHLTSSLSNLGQIQLPDEMIPFVEHYGMIPPLGADMPLDMSVVSTCGKTEITFMRSIQEANVERHFFSALVRDSIMVTLTSNLL